MVISLLMTGLILASLPIINWIIEYSFSLKDKRLNLFKKHLTCYYFDFIFVFFNFLWVYVFNLNLLQTFFLSAISLIAGIFLYIHWSNVSIKEKKESFMFDLKTKKVTGAGIAHFVYQTIQLFLVLGFLISSVKSSIAYIECVIFGLFLIAMIPSSKKIHGKVLFSDLVFSIMGIIVLIIKMIYIGSV